MIEIFDTIVYQPLYNILILLYNFLPGGDFGVAIVVITLIIKSALIPISKKQIESQKRLQEIQPKIKEIQNKYKNDKEKQTKEIMNFYKNNKVNPFSGCLPMIVQLIFLIAIYRILFNISEAGLVVSNGDLYSFVKDPGGVNPMFLGMVDLAKPSYVLAILAAAAQFFQTKSLMDKKKNLAEAKPKKEEKPGEPDLAQMMNKQMLYVGPVLTLFIGFKFAAGLALYWLVSTLFSLIQQIYIGRKENN